MENDKPTQTTTKPDQNISGGVDPNSVLQKPGIAFTVTVWTIGLLIMLVLGYVFNRLWPVSHGMAANTPSAVAKVNGVVAIDSGRIFNQRIKNFMQHDAGTSDKQKTLDEASDFGRRFHDIVDGYGKQGYLVINARAILAGPEGVDKTQEVAAKMGITLDAPDANQ